MVLLRGTYILILILLATLVAGCIVPHGPVKEASIETQCPVRENTNPWITVNPVGNHYLGDVIKINGTTNIKKGNVTIWIKDKDFHTCLNRGDSLEGPCTCCEGVTLTAPIISGINGNNTWSTEVNTSQHRFYPAEFLMWIIYHDCRDFVPFPVPLNITAVSRTLNNSSENVTLYPGTTF